MAIPIISSLLERLFGPPEDPHSRDDVKRRLKVVLAHDRLALDPQTLEMMRQEIIAVVSRYVEIDFDSLEFSLATDQRVTALTANLPIRRIRALGRDADEPIAPEAEADKIELASQAEIAAMDAEIARAILRKFEAENRDGSDPTNVPLDIDRSGLDEIDNEAGDDADKANEANEEFSESAHAATTDELETESAEESALDVPDMSIPESVETIGKVSTETT